MPKLLKSLLLKLSFIQSRIDYEHSKGSKDWLKLMRLKKTRLKIKDRINAMAVMHLQQPRRKALVTLPLKVK